MSMASFGVILYCCYCLQRQIKKAEPVIDTDTTDIGIPLPKWSPEQILELAKKEEPIDKPFHDYFDMAITATRIADIIKNGESNQNDFIQNCSIGLMGKFGSGKTSLINLVKEQLNENSSNCYIFCCVSCWGFSTSTAALQFILDQIITTIAETGINTDSIQGLPTKYIRVITGESSWWERLLKVFINEFENTPETILNNLIKILQQEKRPLILVIEDIDRNEPKHFSVEDIFAALQQFKNVKNNLSLILAGLPYKEDLRIEFEKLCDYIITVPNIDISTIRILFKTIISHHNSQFPDDIKLDDNFLPSSLGYENYHDNNVDYFIEGNFLLDMDDRERGRLSHNEAFRLLMERVTPRTLKHIIRHLDFAWQNIHGECDYVELLLLTILKYAANELFGFIQNNIVELRRASENPKTDVNQKLITKIKELLSNPKNHLSRDATIYWLDFLFPGISHLLNYNEVRSDRREHARRVANSAPVDYFNRILNEVRPPQEISDQRILHAIQDWNNNENTQELVDLLSECQRPEDNYYEHWFHALQDNSRILNLTQEVFFAKLQLNTEFDEGCRILNRIWKSNSMQHIENFVEWFDKIFQKILPCNIKFAADIYLMFACIYYENGSSIITVEEIDKITRQFVEIAHQTLATPKDIIQTCFASTNQPQCSLKEALIRYRRSNESIIPGGGDVSDWNWLAPILIEGLKSQDNDIRNKIYTLTAHLVGNFNTRPENGQLYYSFSMTELINPMFVDPTFGDQVETLMELLSKFNFSPDIVGLNHKGYALVQNEAREWLQKNSNQSQENSSNE
ncbi:MAG: KAP family NTPase [Planctomycetaceae bacterium]|jgi:hypothetical protein|nr:KAP family NTPase [Planctomycetaceae bacterium]